MNKIIHKNTLALLAVMVMLMATLFTACGSGKEDNASATEDTTNVEVTKEAEPAETTEAEEVAEVEPVVEEPIAEPTPEPVVYEGIDMESTLPGLEWIQTFDGIIEEPKMVIFNDETNKKVIVEVNQKVEFTDTDTFAIYLPKGKEVIGEEYENIAFNELTAEYNVDIFKKPSARFHDGDEVEIKNVYEMDGNEYVLTATLIVKK